jgi:DNA topoisomerase IA
MQPARVSEESKPTTQASGLLYDLTSLQREANGRFGFSVPKPRWRWRKACTNATRP